MLLTDFMPSFDPFKPFIETIGNLHNLFYVNGCVGKTAFVNALIDQFFGPIFHMKIKSISKLPMFYFLTRSSSTRTLLCVNHLEFCCEITASLGISNSRLCRQLVEYRSKLIVQFCREINFDLDKNLFLPCSCLKLK